jgi:hypothetical protein
MAISQATYDCLFIGSKLQDNIEDFSEGEIQLFAYLSCLLALYDGKNVSSWGYLFIKNKIGSPYSVDISNATNSLKRSNCLIDADKDQYYNISEKGGLYLEQFSKHSSNLSRTKYLELALSMMNFFPYGVLTKAINDEPILLSLRGINVRRNLLDIDGSGLALLYEQFKLLKQVLKDGEHQLIKPAYVWLNSLAYFKPDVHE